MPQQQHTMVPAKAMDNVRDSIALVRCYLTADTEGAWAILTGTSDPQGCMTVLAILVQGTFLNFGIGPTAAGALLDDLARSLGDTVLDLSTQTPLTRDQRQGAG